MTDRLHKQPKWVQEEFEALRTKLALRWPSEPKPEPAWQPQEWVPPGHDGETVYRAGANGAVRTFQVVRDHIRESTSAFLPCGRYYRTAREAILARLWDEAERSAKVLRRLEIALDEWRDE